MEAARSSTRGGGWARSGSASRPGCPEPPRAARRALRRRGSRAGALPRGHIDRAAARVGGELRLHLEEGRLLLDLRRGRREVGLSRGAMCCGALRCMMHDGRVRAVAGSITHMLAPDLVERDLAVILSRPVHGAERPPAKRGECSAAVPCGGRPRGGRRGTSHPQEPLRNVDREAPAVYGQHLALFPPKSPWSAGKGNVFPGRCPVLFFARPT